MTSGDAATVNYQTLREDLAEKSFFFLRVKFTGPQYEDMPEDQKYHFVAARIDPHESKWLFLPGEEGGQFLKASLDTVVHLLTDRTTHLLERLSRPFEAVAM